MMPRGYSDSLNAHDTRRSPSGVEAKLASPVTRVESDGAAPLGSCELHLIVVSATLHVVLLEQGITTECVLDLVRSVYATRR
jgi:hypothetical protein